MRNSARPRATFWRVAINVSSRESSSPESCTGRHSSRRLQLEHATFNDVSFMRSPQVDAIFSRARSASLRWRKPAHASRRQIDGMNANLIDAPVEAPLFPQGLLSRLDLNGPRYT